MTSKVLSYGVVGLLAVALLAGAGYILLNPAEAGGQGPSGGQGQGRGGSGSWQSGRGAVDGGAAYGQGQGRRQGSNRAQGWGASGGAGTSGERGGNAGGGQGRKGTASTVAWETLTGTVTGIDGEVTIQTAEGEMLIGMGQSAYWQDFQLDVGDEITITGFHEDGQFKAGSVENLTTGETINLRDGSGRPMWAGRGRF